MFGSFTTIHFTYLVTAIGWTLALSAIAFTFGASGGFGVALARISPRRWLRWTALIFIECIQGMPLLILLFIVYFGLSVYGFSLPSIVAAGLALMIYVSAYLGDIWRGCIEAMPKPQWEASECLAMTRWQTLRLVIIPQAVRLSLPPTVGLLVAAGDQDDVARVGHWVRRTHPSRTDRQQLDFSTLFDFQFGGCVLLYFVLPAVALERNNGEKTQCRQSLSYTRSIRASGQIKSFRACRSRSPREK